MQDATPEYDDVTEKTILFAPCLKLSDFYVEQRSTEGHEMGSMQTRTS